MNAPAKYNLAIMTSPRAAPRFDEYFPELNRFILQLVNLYERDKICSWDDLEMEVKDFFDPETMVKMESLLPGWQKMASYSAGITLVHVMCVFLGMYMMPEFQDLTADRQNMMRWVILFHDIAKFHISGKKDTMHAFNSAVVAAWTLRRFGFPVTSKYSELIPYWTEETTHAFFVKEGDRAPTPDNRKLPQILAGIEQLYGENTPATLIVKTVLLHISLHVDKMYPTPAPLTKEETKRYVTPSLFPLLRVMMMSDNEGWSLFEPETRARQRKDTLAAFEEVGQMIA